jgi:Fe-S-cluster-containing hydrogenase component 2
MDAISVDDVAHINLDRCIGCGVCAVTCPIEAVKVFRKEKNKEFIPEKDMFKSTMAIYQQRRE